MGGKRPLIKSFRFFFPSRQKHANGKFFDARRRLGLSSGGGRGRADPSSNGKKASAALPAGG
jgi:hypothetical protein